MTAPEEAPATDLLEQAAQRMWAAWEERVTGTPWRHAGPWRARKYLQMAQVLHTAGLLVDPAIGRDLNRLQTSRDEWRGRAEHAEGTGKLDRKRANDAARESAAARSDADELQGRLDAQSDELEAARDRGDRLQRVVDLIDTRVAGWTRGGCVRGCHTAKEVWDIIHQDDET